MKILIPIIALVCFNLADLKAQTEFTLEPSQSMIMTGKGPGQDATINPFSDQDCIAIVENIGAREFSIRIQFEGEIMEEIIIKAGETKKVKLLKAYQLYLDPNPKGIAKARVSYQEEE